MIYNFISGKFRRTSFVNKNFKFEVVSSGEDQQIKLHFGDLEATMVCTYLTFIKDKSSSKSKDMCP